MNLLKKYKRAVTIFNKYRDADFETPTPLHVSHRVIKLSQKLNDPKFQRRKQRNFGKRVDRQLDKTIAWDKEQSRKERANENAPEI